MATCKHCKADSRKEYQQYCRLNPLEPRHEWVEDSRYNKIPLHLENELRCGCSEHSDIVCKYNNDTVEIRCKHGRFVRLKVVEGKLQEDKYIEQEEKVLKGGVFQLTVPLEILDFLKKRYGDYEIYITYSPYIMVFDGAKQTKIELIKFKIDNYIFWALWHGKIYLLNTWKKREDERG